MSPQETIAKLESIGFFENYPEQAAALIKEHVLKGKLAEQVKKTSEEDAEGLAACLAAYPAVALFPRAEHVEWDGTLAKLLKHIAKNSFGLFTPENVKVKSRDAGQIAFLQFQLGGQTFADEVERLDEYIPLEFFPIINDALQHGHGLNFYVFDFPKELGYHHGWTFATERAMGAAVEAGLLPKPYNLTGSVQAGIEERLVKEIDHWDLPLYMRSCRGEDSDRFMPTVGAVLAFYGPRNDSVLSYPLGISFVRKILCVPDDEAFQGDYLAKQVGTPYLWGTDCLFAKNTDTVLQYTEWGSAPDSLDAALALKPFDRAYGLQAVFDEYFSLKRLTIDGVKKIRSVDQEAYVESNQESCTVDGLSLLREVCPLFLPKAQEDFQRFDDSGWRRDA